MYTIFIDKSKLILTSELKTQLSEGEIFCSIKELDLEKFLKQLDKGKIQTAYAYHPNELKLMKKLKKKITLVKAAGGVVRNSKKEFLFIYRNKKWDLPKGKLNKRESIEMAAIREVEEETGVKNLTIDSFITDTYHIFKREETYFLKKTTWFLMSTDFKDTLIPQQEEGITKVCWKTDAEIPKILKKSYPNIGVLFDHLSQEIGWSQ